MQRTIARNTNLAMIVEFNPPALTAAGYLPESFLTQLRDLGFDAEAILTGGRLIPVEELQYPVNDPYWFVNLLCRRQKKGL
jgi:hypothetical protein